MNCTKKMKIRQKSIIKTENKDTNSTIYNKLQMQKETIIQFKLK